MGELLLRLALGATAFAGGVLLARRSLKAATAVGAALLALILLKVAVGYLPAAEATAFPWDFYPLVERWWYEVPGLALLGVGLWVGRASLVKRDVVLIVAGLLFVRIVITPWQASDEPAQLTGRVEEDGFCRQSSGYSCSAAAAVMYLHRLGVVATEAEMAVHCATRRDGTTDAGLARGLRRKLPGRRVEVSAPAYEALQAPALVSIRIQHNISHSVLLEASGPDGVRLADPLGSRRRMSREAFLACWQGSAIRAQ